MLYMIPLLLCARGGNEFSRNAQGLTPKTPKTHAENQNFSESAQNPTPKTAKTTPEADRLGLVATWSRVFGYLSIHNPTTGTWHDLPTKGALDWTRREARRRKELYKSGDRKAYRYTSGKMEQLWEAERAPEPEGIVEDHPIEEEDPSP
jgi:hypothetical protein